MGPLDPHSNNLPKRSELPEIPGAPKGALWFWGEDDDLGRINMLTPERTAAAARLITTGEVVSLNWPMNLPDPPMFGRQCFRHEIIPVHGFGNDDVFEMNSQSSSQLDGLRHVSLDHNGKRTYYNNVVQHDIETTTRIGIQAWSEKGIVGRGVLIDYYKFKNSSYDPFSQHRISVDDIKACATAQGVQFQYGDILIIRTGVVSKYNALTAEGRKQLISVAPQDAAFVGIEQSEEMLDFIHDNYFSIVVSDNPGVEALPQPPGFILHLIFIPLWGLGLGELFDLEKLSGMCEKYGRYEFFFSSSPPNIPGAVGCYPNALAIF